MTLKIGSINKQMITDNEITENILESELSGSDIELECKTIQPRNRDHILTETKVTQRKTLCFETTYIVSMISKSQDGH